MSDVTLNELNELNEADLDAVAGGIDILAISSAAGHLGRAFAFGYAIGTAIYSAYDYLSNTEFSGDFEPSGMPL